jgi:hypothetical protein
MARKVGTCSAAAYYVNCPRCDAGWLCPSTGSYMIGFDSIDAVRKTNKDRRDTVMCSACAAPFVLPKAIRRLA